MDSDDRVLREEMLRREVLAGNEQTWQIWYGETFDDLYRYVLWRCGGRRDWADEIVQETWLWAVRRMRRFAPGQGSFLAWMRDCLVRDAEPFPQPEKIIEDTTNSPGCR